MGDVRDLLRSLDSAFHEHLSLFKMLSVKSSEADSAFKRIRAHLVKGDVTQAEKVLSHLESGNAHTQREVSGHLQDGDSVMELIAAVGQAVQQDRKEGERSKSRGRERGAQENGALRRQIEELQDKVREYELARTNHLGKNAKEMLN
jgi:hypothetical protein